MFMIDFENLQKSTVAIRCKMDRLQDLKDTRVKITEVLAEDKVQTSLQGDKLSVLTAEILDLENELLSDVLEIEKLRKDADAFLLENLSSKNYEIMHARLILGLTVKDTALTVGVTRQTVYNVEKRFNKQFTIV